MPRRVRWALGAALAGVLATIAPASAHVSAFQSHRSARQVLDDTAPCATPPRGVNNYAPGSGRTVALTFDDGPGATTAAVLQVLHDENVPATFFNLGVQQHEHPDVVRTEQIAGYALGNHTWDHAVLPQLTPDAQARELERASAEQARILGGRPCLFRAPYGSYDSTTVDDADAAGMALWNWSVDTEDWKAQGSSDETWVHRIISRAEAGGSQEHPVILMHNQATPNPATLAALRPVIRYYRDRGYRFVDLYGREALPAAPVEVRTGRTTHELVVRRDGVLFERAQTPKTAWSRWHALGSGFVDGPAAVPVGTTAAVVVARGSDGTLRTARLDDHHRVSEWHDLGREWVGRPSLSVARNGTVVLVARGIDDAVWMTRRVGGSWETWRSLGEHLIASPAVAATPDGLLVVGVDTRGVVIARELGHPWYGTGRVTHADPALAMLPNGDVLLALRTDTGRVEMARWRPGAGWHSVAAPAGVIGSAPALVADETGVRLVGVGSDGADVTAAWRGARDGWTRIHAQQ